MPDTAVAPRGKVIAAFAIVYVVWGSTYLAILFAIETLPPFLMAGVRFLIAGSILYGFLLVTRAERPTRSDVKHALIIGAFLLLGGNGAVVWAQQVVPSGVAALLVATVPCWMVLLEALRPGGARPTKRVIGGLVLGLLGLVLLIGPEALLGGGRVDTIGAIVLVCGSLCWASGSIYSKTVTIARPMAAPAMQMLWGGALLLLLGTVSGELSDVDIANVSVRSMLAVLYLIVFGSLIAYSAYTWLLRMVPAARVATYAYVNPVVAVVLGWLFASEPLTLRMIIAAAVIVAGVVLITAGGERGHTRLAMTGSARMRELDQIRELDQAGERRLAD